MLKNKLKLGIILAIVSSAQTFAGYSTLELSRSKIKYPKYNLETKKLVFNQAKLALTDIFVHRDVKIKDFGPVADPLPKLNALESKLSTISDTNFHKSLTDIFIGLKDLHTMYHLPKPFSCYESFLPLRFKYVNIGPGKKAFAVTDVHTKKEVLDLLPETFSVAPGDLVISYNGVPLYQAVQKKMSETYGANSEAQFRLAQDDLRYYGHGVDQLPTGDFVDLEFENAQGQRYKHKLPWITYTDDDCIKPAPAILPIKTMKMKRMGSFKGDTEEPILYWHINSPSFGNFGYIELTSFNPQVLSNAETVIKIQNLLLNELRDTDGLVIDLRDNNGGQIPLAEKIVQLFSPREVFPLQYILKNSETNYVYFKKSDIEDPFTALLVAARKLGTSFTTSESISEKEEINDLGQAYFKPVAVFVNSKCYSSCEVLAAQMQDHEVGTIFGEDLQTGGGGANVYNLDKILQERFAQTDPAPFARIPHGQDIQFSFRQAIRVGKNAGALIENAGVRVDRVSPMGRRDIFNATNDQLLVLQEYLSSITTAYTSSIFFESEERHDFVKNHEPLIWATWTDTTTFEFKKDGKTIDKREVNLNASSVFSLPVNVELISDGRVEIYGSKNEIPVWRKIVRYRVIPEYTPVIEDENLIERLSVYSVSSSKENGWQKKGQEFLIGNGKGYQNLVETEASLFVSIPQKNSKLSYIAKVESEVDFDFFNVYVIESGKKPTLIQSLSGHRAETNYSIDLSSFAGKNIEIRFVFKTDEGTKDKGVTLKGIRID